MRASLHTQPERFYTHTHPQTISSGHLQDSEGSEGNGILRGAFNFQPVFFESFIEMHLYMSLIKILRKNLWKLQFFFVVIRRRNCFVLFFFLSLCPFLLGRDTNGTSASSRNALPGTSAIPGDATCRPTIHSRHAETVCRRAAVRDLGIQG